MDSILGRTILGYKVIEKIGTGGFGDGLSKGTAKM